MLICTDIACCYCCFCNCHPVLVIHQMLVEDLQPMACKWSRDTLTTTRTCELGSLGLSHSCCIVSATRHVDAEYYRLLGNTLQVYSDLSILDRQDQPCEYRETGTCSLSVLYVGKPYPCHRTIVGRHGLTNLQHAWVCIEPYVMC